uniref:hypothetical protein n=1 Tax=Halomonas sp. 11-S5 TaxID=2994064 RepID=UPI0024688260
MKGFRKLTLVVAMGALASTVASAQSSPWGTDPLSNDELAAMFNDLLYEGRVLDDQEMEQLLAWLPTRQSPEELLLLYPPGAGNDESGGPGTVGDGGSAPVAGGGTGGDDGGGDDGGGDDGGGDDGGGDDGGGDDGGGDD